MQCSWHTVKIERILPNTLGNNATVPENTSGGFSAYQCCREQPLSEQNDATVDAILSMDGRSTATPDQNVKLEDYVSNIPDLSDFHDKSAKTTIGSVESCMQNTGSTTNISTTGTLYYSHNVPFTVSHVVDCSDIIPEVQSSRKSFSDNANPHSSDTLANHLRLIIPLASFGTP